MSEGGDFVWWGLVQGVLFQARFHDPTDRPVKGGEGWLEGTCKTGRRIRRAETGVIKIINAVI